MFTILDHSVSNQFFRRLRSGLLLLSLAILLGLAFAPAEAQNFNFSVSDTTSSSFRITFSNVPGNADHIRTYSLPFPNITCTHRNCSHYSYSPFSSFVWGSLSANTAYTVSSIVMDSNDYMITKKVKQVTTSS